MKYIELYPGLIETRDQQVVSLGGGLYGVLDHGIQTIVAEGTKEECENYVRY